mmetsp:Transcript_6722/g.9686  ORF Transcript_6722/g.9686 Transcript_6722/m.9686 type:complete len:447 (-) Transcript_6722:58-1398(-)
MTTVDKNDDSKHNIPVIDLSLPKREILPQLTYACSEWGFFQLINHTQYLPHQLVQDYRNQMAKFFSLPREIKLSLKRDEANARGYFDDELTKQRRDWKECLDVGMPGSRDWTMDDDASDNACLDGFNRFPTANFTNDSVDFDAKEFRSVVVRYFRACEDLSRIVTLLMVDGLGANYDGKDHLEEKEENEENLIKNLLEKHTSYLRSNYYPPCPPLSATEVNGIERYGDAQPLGISPHTDAGFLTILIQDDNCHSLQVARHPPLMTNTKNTIRDFSSKELEWITVHPIPGAVTVNTGDMATIWSNGLYRAPLHRVLTDPEKERYSAPFFYNPGYDALVQPLSRLIGEDLSAAKYWPCSWGYFRAVRFAGDLTNIGAEVQILDFETNPHAEKDLKDDDDKQQQQQQQHQQQQKDLNPHIQKQQEFLKIANFQKPFSVEHYRPLLQGDS